MKNENHEEGKKQGLLLLSDGIDSPVAGRMMKQKGIIIDAVTYYNGNVDYGKIEILARKIGVRRLFSINLQDANTTFDVNCDSRYQCIFCKRMMYRIGNMIAMKHGQEFLITGENLGQVASQTLDNMRVLDNASDIPVIRPVLVFNKMEIVERAKKIGTFDMSRKNTRPCPFIPSKPLTRAKQENLERQESLLDIKDLMGKCMESMSISILE